MWTDISDRCRIGPAIGRPGWSVFYDTPWCYAIDVMHPANQHEFSVSLLDGFHVWTNNQEYL